MKKYWGLFLIFPLSQILTIWGAYQAAGGLDGRGVAGLILAPVADILILFLIVRAQKKEKAEYELERVRMIRTAETGRNERLADSQRTVLELKEALSAEFARVKEAIEQEESDKLAESWRQFEESLAETRQANYTENAVVNAVLGEKQKQCRKELGIGIQIEATLPGALSIEPMQLCSIFSNLLDNAMEAVSELKEAERFIKLCAGIRADNLWVRVNNPALESHVKRERREGHGYGRRILEAIARKHNGVLTTSYKNGVFEAALMLEATEGEVPAC